MYLARLNISNFRKIQKAELEFQPTLNILVGANNVGKTAVVDAIRALIGTHSDPYQRLSSDDIHLNNDGTTAGNIVFSYVFRGLDVDDEADFLPALVQCDDGSFEVHISIKYVEADKTGRLSTRRWCGTREDLGVTTDMLENLRGVYLPPLRDASRKLKPSRNSQLAKLFQLLADDGEREAIDSELKVLDEKLKKHKPIANIHSAIRAQHGSMLGVQLAQELAVGLSGTDFQKLSSRLSILADTFEVEQNGLGFNNLIYMAVVLSELAKDPQSCYRGLIIEEPEAHLHPQLQAVLLNYLQTIGPEEGEKPVQLFVTSHSPNFASIADLNCLTCLVDTDGVVEAFFPKNITFEKGKREKLERYLDVTRAEIFFARRVIFVEGAAELMLLSVLAQKSGYNLRQHGVSLISVEGLNFDSFLPLFGELALKIPVALITDADPMSEPTDGSKPMPLYPAINDQITASANTIKMKQRGDEYVQIFHGVKTLEYDLALIESNRKAMLRALKDIHPQIGSELETELHSGNSDADNARILFRGMFERSSANVQKGRFSQALAQVIADSDTFVVPCYIKDAIEHVCKQ